MEIKHHITCTQCLWAFFRWVLASKARALGAAGNAPDPVWENHGGGFWTIRNKKNGKWRKCESYFRASTPWLAAMNWVDRLHTSVDERVLSGRRAVVIAWWAAAGFGCSSLTLRFSVNSHFGHSQAGSSACSPTGALLHRCFPPNLSTTMQGAIVKMRGASSKLCTLFIWSVWNSKTALARGPWTVLGYVGKRRWGVEGYWCPGSGYNEVAPFPVVKQKHVSWQGFWSHLQIRSRASAAAAAGL